MKLIVSLFLEFAKIGLFTFGGGYAMIPLIENACVANKGWISHDEMMDITVIAESTPGPIAVNCATFVGYKQRGLLGAIAATAGIVLPSLVVICIIAAFLDRFLEIRLVANAFQGIKVAVGVLILGAALKMIRKMPSKPIPRAIMAGAACIMLLANVFAVHLSTVIVMLAFGFVSLMVFLVQGNTKKKGGAA